MFTVILMTFVFFLKLDFSQPEAIITQWLPSSVLANLHGHYFNRLCTAKSVNKGKLGTNVTERAKV